MIQSTSKPWWWLNPSSCSSCSWLNPFLLVVCGPCAFIQKEIGRGAYAAGSGARGPELECKRVGPWAFHVRQKESGRGAVIASVFLAYFSVVLVFLAGLGALVFVLITAGMGIKAAAGDVSVECIFEGHSPRARNGGRPGKNVAKGAGLGLACLLGHLAVDIVKHGALVRQVV